MRHSSESSADDFSRSSVRLLGSPAPYASNTSWCQAMMRAVAQLRRAHAERTARVDQPAIDLSETERLFQIRADVPGMEADDLEVKVEGNHVTLSGIRMADKATDDRTFHRVERHRGSFRRTFTLPEPIAVDAVVANYRSGVLTIELPKLESKCAMPTCP